MNKVVGVIALLVAGAVIYFLYIDSMNRGGGLTSTPPTGRAPASGQAPASRSAGNAPPIKVEEAAEPSRDDKAATFPPFAVKLYNELKAATSDWSSRLNSQDDWTAFATGSVGAGDEDLKYDVTRTDSALTPLVGVVYVHCTQAMYDGGRPNDMPDLPRMLTLSVSSVLRIELVPDAQGWRLQQVLQERWDETRFEKRTQIRPADRTWRPIQKSEDLYKLIEAAVRSANR